MRSLRRAFIESIQTGCSCGSSRAAKRSATSTPSEAQAISTNAIPSTCAIGIVKFQGRAMPRKAQYIHRLFDRPTGKATLR